MATLIWSLEKTRLRNPTTACQYSSNMIQSTSPVAFLPSAHTYIIPTPTMLAFSNSPKNIQKISEIMETHFFTIALEIPLLMARNPPPKKKTAFLRIKLPSRPRQQHIPSLDNHLQPWGFLDGKITGGKISPQDPNPDGIIRLKFLQVVFFKCLGQLKIMAKQHGTAVSLDVYSSCWELLIRCSYC